MKNKLFIFVFLFFSTPVKAISKFDLIATWIVASYVYSGWVEWVRASQGYRPTEEIIKDLRNCLKALQYKVNQEQNDIKQLSQQLKRLEATVGFIPHKQVI
jgi:cell shape-determining protein MreC